MEVRIITTKSGHEGYDLNDVVREILAAVMEKRGWSENRAAKEIGLTQKSLNRFMGRKHGLRLEQLSKICADLQINPVAFLQSHEVYQPETRSKLRFAKDAVYERFRTSLANDEAHELTALVEEAKRLGAFGDVLDQMRAAVAGAKAARRKAIQDGREKNRQA